jgi:MtN3 and saliva related transmembrane protein
MELIAWVGTTAAVCTTISFVPQIVKIMKQGGADLSYGMLFLYLAGTVLWLVYGLMLRSAPVIYANGLTAFLVAVALGLKVARAGQRARHQR